MIIENILVITFALLALIIVFGAATKKHLSNDEIKRRIAENSKISPSEVEIP